MVSESKELAFFFSIFLIFQIYSVSTFDLAQGVLRKKVKLDLMLGSLAKQLMRILRAISSQPNRSTRSVKIFSNVTPCSGSLLMRMDLKTKTRILHNYRRCA
jgi:hypothetical protein